MNDKNIELTNDFGGNPQRRPEITGVPEGVQVVDMNDTEAMHNTIAEALGE